MQSRANSYWEKEYLSNFDFIIIGAGLVGLSCAASLLEEAPQSQILILERGLLPYGASTRNAGFACFGSPTELLANIRQKGLEKTLQTVAQRWHGLQRLLERLSPTDIGFEPTGSYELIGEKHEHAIEQVEWLNTQLYPIFGQKVFYPKDEDLSKLGFRQVRHLVYTPLEGKLNTGKLMRTLLSYVLRRGAWLLSGARVIDWQSHQAGVEVYVEQAHTNEPFCFRAQQIAVCTNAFSRELLPDLCLQAGRGQVLITKPLDRLPFSGVFHYDEGYFYFRDIDGRVLLGGGRNLDPEGESTTQFGNTPLIYQELVKQLREIILPGVDFDIDYAWSGIMAFSPDQQPILRRYNPCCVIGVALNGMGVALASQLGQQLAHMLLQH